MYVNNVKMISAEHSSNNGKNKLRKKPHSMVIFEDLIETLTLEVTPQEKIELKVIQYFY